MKKLNKNFIARIWDAAKNGHTLTAGKYTYDLNLRDFRHGEVIERRLTSDYGTTAMLSTDGMAVYSAETGEVVEG